MGFVTGLTTTLRKRAVLDSLGLPAFDGRMTASAKVDTCLDQQTGMLTAVRAVAVAAPTLGYWPVNPVAILLPSNARMTGLT
jgi:hypothetical protein